MSRFWNKHKIQAITLIIAILLLWTSVPFLSHNLAMTFATIIMLGNTIVEFFW